MKVMLFTQDGPLYMPLYLEPLLEKKEDSITDVVLASGSDGFIDELVDRYRMFGPKAFIKYGLIYSRGKILDALPGSIGYYFSGRYHSVRSIAKSHGIPLHEVPDINGPEFIEFVHDRDPDLILSIACGQIMDKDLLSIPDKGAVNLHGSLLPKYRGLSTSFWVLYHGEEVGGVTAHYMTSTLDDGEIIIQRKYAITPDDSMHDLYLKLVDLGANIAIDVIDKIERGEVETKPNPSNEGEYYSRPTSEDRREFLRRGNEFM